MTADEKVLRVYQFMCQCLKDRVTVVVAGDVSQIPESGEVKNIPRTLDLYVNNSREADFLLQEAPFLFESNKFSIKYNGWSQDESGVYQQLRYTVDNEIKLCVNLIVRYLHTIMRIEHSRFVLPVITSYTYFAECIRKCAEEKSGYSRLYRIWYDYGLDEAPAYETIYLVMNYDGYLDVVLRECGEQKVWAILADIGSYFC